MKKLLLACLAVALAGVGCNRRTQNEAAVRQAVERYLASRPNLNMQGMDLAVTSVKVRDEKAEAEVTFRAKTDSKAIMSMHYNLKRRGGKWEVEPQSGGHGASMPPMEGSAELPGGHPPVGSSSPTPPAAGELPPGHPPVKKQ